MLQFRILILQWVIQIKMFRLQVLMDSLMDNQLDYLSVNHIMRSLTNNMVSLRGILIISNQICMANGILKRNSDFTFYIYVN